MVLKNPDKYQKGKTIVYFVRHGDRDHLPNQKDAGMIVPGPGLSKLGKKQAKEVAKKLSKLKGEIDFLYTSPMARAYETAIEIGKKINKKPIVLANFEEVNKILEHPKFFSRTYWKALSDFRKKEKIFNKVLEKHKEKVVLIVAHGRLNKMLIGRKLGLSCKDSRIFDYHNCHISLVRFRGKKLDYIHYFNSKGLAD